MSELKKLEIFAEYKLKNNGKILRHHLTTEQYENLKQTNMIEFLRILE